MNRRPAQRKSGFAYNGLTTAEAERRLATNGPNVLSKKRQFSAGWLFLSQFKSPLIYVLLLAAIVTWYLGDFVDMWVILAAVFVNTILGFYQEYRAQRNLEALSAVLTQRAVVVRDGVKQEIDASRLVEGDLAYVRPGEKIPGDGVLVRAKRLVVDEAILTGESMTVHKGVWKGGRQKKGWWERIQNEFSPSHETKKTQVKTSVYMGTTVASGGGEMVVLRTGNDTEVGAIAKSLSMAQEEETPLQARLRKFSYMLAIGVGIISVCLLIIGLLSGQPFEEIFTVSVAVAVAAIPEGLVVSLTAILAVGMQRILKKKALVRKLVAAEVLGSVSVICSDKTGTLTEGLMRVTTAEATDDKQLVMAAIIGNDLTDPLELGMWDWAKKQIARNGLGAGSFRSIDDLVKSTPVIDRLEFTSERRYAATLTKQGLYVVGAPEQVLMYSSMKRSERKNWGEKIDGYGKQGLRVLGFGYKQITGKKRISRKMVKGGLHWLGLLVYEDPVRRGVAVALKRANSAGIGVKVVTGDYAETARAVMKQLGQHVRDSEVMEGSELDGISEMELRRKVNTTVLFARTTPQQKLRIVEALQGRGEVVAVTGDGVNDAPALHKADIGVVVSTASDVSKETADIVLLDDNFATIVDAVEEGRGIFDNLRKVLLYLLSDSFTEVFLVTAAIILGLPLPVTAAQILWVNLIDDGLPNLALTIDPKENDLLKQKPRTREEPLLNGEIKVLIALISIVSALVVLFVYMRYFEMYDLTTARTIAFTVLGVDSLLYVFSSRSLREPIWKDGFLKNKWLVAAVVGGLVLQVSALYVPFLQRVLQTVPLGVNDWLVVLAAGMIVIATIEVVKWLYSRKHVFLGGQTLSQVEF